METTMNLNTLAPVLKRPVQCPECLAEMDRKNFEEYQHEYQKELIVKKIFEESGMHQAKIKKAKKLRSWVNKIAWVSGIIIGFNFIFWEPRTANRGITQGIHLWIMSISMLIFMVSLIFSNWLKDRPDMLFEGFKKELEKNQ